MAEDDIIFSDESNENLYQENKDLNEQKSKKPSNEGRKGNLNLVLTIINLILLVGIIVLYFVLLKPGEQIPVKAFHKASSGSVSVAYVNSDTILSHYELVKQMREELQQRTTRYETEITNKQKSLEKDAAYFQEQVDKGSISEASARDIYGSLMNEQQNLVQLRERYSSDLANREFEMNQLLLDSMQNFLERYNQKMNFDYIFSYNRGGSILSANDSLDITQDVLKLLNEEFEKQK